MPARWRRQVRQLGLTTLFALSLLLSGCARQPEPGTLVFALAQAPVNLDPRYATDAASERINRLIYQRLVEFDAASHVVPGLADWTRLSAQHYRFRLHASMARFHDGSALTAQDVKATYDSLLALPDSPHRAEFAHIHHISTPDTATIDFYLQRPDPHFAARLIIGILPASVIASGHDLSHQPIGNGPYRVDHWQAGLQLKRVADGLRVRFVEVKDPTVRVLKLKRGEVDVLQGDLPPELVKYLQTQPGVTVNTSVGANYSYLGVNTRRGPLSDARVRRAIAHAIDTQAIVQAVMVDYSRPATAILPPEHYAGNPALPPYPYNPALARQLLLTAGIRLPLSLTYKTSTDPQRVRLATILQAQMREAGIALQIKSLDWGTFYADVQQGQVELFGLTWVGIQTPEIYGKVFGSQSEPPAGFNRGGYRDISLDQLLASEDWPAVTARIHAQLPYIPLWYEGQFVAYGHRVVAYAATADGNLDGLAEVKWRPEQAQTSDRWLP